MQNPNESRLRRETNVPVLLTITSVAAMLDLSRTHIMRLESAGKFPKHIRLLHNRRHYREQDIVNWYYERRAEQQRNEAIPETTAL